MAQSMKDPVDFSIGQPDFNAPDAVKEAAIKAIRDNDNGYTLTAGIEPLRGALAEQIAEEFNWAEPSVIITCGVSGALHLASLATINPGDEVLVADPYFVIYKYMVSLANGRCVFVDTYPDFKITAERVARCLTPKSKILVINSPANPTGAVYDKENLKAIAELAARHNLLVISDEIYRDFSYDGPAVSIASFYENTLVLRGFSKSYGIAGWRLGFMAAPESLIELMEKMLALQQYTFVCAAHPLQIAALTALECDTSEQCANYRRKRDLVYEGLKEAFELVRPEGAFYAFATAPGGKAGEFVTAAIKNGVLVIPGAVFSRRDSHFRISYATSDEMIRKGVERLCRLAEKG